MSQGKIERVYYDRTPGVLITSSRAEFGSTAYALSGIVSVQSARIPPSRGSAIVLLLVGLLFAALGAMVDGGALIGIGVMVAVLGGVMIAKAKTLYVVQIVTAAGQLQPHSSENGDEIAQISLALKQAIADR